MKSANSSEILDLDQGIPTTWDDVIALRRARNSQRMSLSAYFDFLSRLPQPSMAELRTRKHPAGIKPFEL